VLAEVAFVDGEREGEHGHDKDELNPIESGVDGAEAGDALGQVAHARGPAETQQQPHDDDGAEEIP